MIIEAIKGVIDNLTKDTFTYTDKNVVKISCNNRGDPVIGLLSSPLKLRVQAEYKDFKSYGGGASQVIEFADSATTALTGATVQQPWFSRQYWTNTSPLEITTVLSFIATTSAEQEVFSPVERLIGFLYPRQITQGSGNGLAELYAPPGPNLFSGKSGTTSDGNDIITNTATGKSGLHLEGAESPDYVTFTMGNLVTLSMCYLKSVDVEFSSVLDPDGYPHTAKATVTVRAFDGSYWPKDGSFHLTQKMAVAFNAGTIFDTVKSVGKSTLGLGG